MEKTDKIEQKIKDRIAKLEADRDAFITQANQQIAAIGAVIGELKALIGEEQDQSDQVQDNHKEKEIPQKV